MKNILKRVDFLIQALILGVWSVLIGFSAYAGSFETSLKNSKLYTGTLDILKGSMNVLLVLVSRSCCSVYSINRFDSGQCLWSERDGKYTNKCYISNI